MCRVYVTVLTQAHTQHNYNQSLIGAIIIVYTSVTQLW